MKETEGERERIIRMGRIDGGGEVEKEKREKGEHEGRTHGQEPGVKRRRGGRGGRGGKSTFQKLILSWCFFQ